VNIYTYCLDQGAAEKKEDGGGGGEEDGFDT